MLGEVFKTFNWTEFLKKTFYVKKQTMKIHLYNTMNDINISPEAVFSVFPVCLK